MSRDSDARERAVFREAVRLPPEERDEFLETACGGDSQLRSRVEGMLLDHVSDPRSGDGTGSHSEEPRKRAPSKQTFIGPYRVIQKIGEGGMGEVFEAEQQTPVRRRVALKIIKRGMETKQVLARFEAERQALALMDHPCVARVFDAGETSRGRPYFAMEYVPGVPITEHCDRHRLTTRQRLELFIPVCEGIQHAHQKAVIHRDIKPSNVLVAIQDGKAFAKIIDFGVAKAVAQPLTERTLFTEMGQLIGTPAYMSPEQAEMTGQNIDTRTDVYSLGAMLYELLVGAAPFDSRKLRQAGLDGIRKTIREIEPPRPSTRISSLGRRLRDLGEKPGDVSPRSLRSASRGSRLDHDEGPREGPSATVRLALRARGRRPPAPEERAGGGQPAEHALSHRQVRAKAPRGSRDRDGSGGAAPRVPGSRWRSRPGASRASADRANRAHDESEAVVTFLSDMLAAVNPGEAGREVSVREVLDETAATIGTELGEEPRGRGPDPAHDGGVLPGARPLGRSGRPREESDRPASCPRWRRGPPGRRTPCTSWA